MEQWFRQAAEQGYAQAQTRLGGMYHSGLGVPRNYAEAMKWYRKAAEQGYAEAQTGLGQIYDFGMGVPKDYVAAYMWYLLAAGQGNQAARARLEEMERDKLITPEKKAEAQKLAQEWKPKKS